VNRIDQLQSRGYESHLDSLALPDEVEPPLAGDLRLVDVETNQVQEVSLDGGLRDLYRRRLAYGRMASRRSAGTQHPLSFLHHHRPLGEGRLV